MKELGSKLVCTGGKPAEPGDRAAAHSLHSTGPTREGEPGSPGLGQGFSTRAGCS